MTVTTAQTPQANCGADVKQAYIGMGANLGDPIEQMVSAKRQLAALSSVCSVRSSKYYLSAPVGYVDQPDFINCVVELIVRSSVRELFAQMQRIETELGRQRDPNNQNAARSIDLDLLWFDGMKIQQEDLVVPHPRLHQRLFVLEPLAELNIGLAEQFRALSMPSDFNHQLLNQLAL